MNRAQRRREERSKQKINTAPKREIMRGWTVIPTPSDAGPDFSTVPLATMCQSIQLLIDELRRRGVPVYDFDNKEKSVQGIQIVHGKVYFLAAKEEVYTDEKV